MTLLLPKMRDEPVESSIASNNEIGVPFTVVLTDDSLSDGIVQLYSRETTIKVRIAAYVTTCSIILSRKSVVLFL